jgi:hypothetical protein
MGANNKFRFTIPRTDKYINIPLEIKWDLHGRTDSIEQYEQTVIEEIIGLPKDYEIARFEHTPYGNNGFTELIYDFYFYNGNPNNISTSVVTDWKNTYLAEGFNVDEIYYLTNQFKRSFFKLDFYDTKNDISQTNYFTIIIPVQQGDTESVVISPFLPNVDIKKPYFKLDYTLEKEGFFIYWLRYTDFLNISTFYMTAKFFDAKLGVFVKMMNTPQASLPGNRFLFTPEDYFYYKVDLDYTTYQYSILDIVTGLRIGNGTPIKWYEYVNP